MDAIVHAFGKAPTRVPAIVAGCSMSGRHVVVGMGDAASSPEPGSMAWEIGSITKVFTGLLLAEMVTRGEVGLDDPLGRYVPTDVAARLPAEEDQPTLRMLASHTAGLPRIPRQWLSRLRKSDDPYAVLSEDDVFEAIGSHTVRPAKTRFSYSNFGAGLLGHLLGRAVGQTYEDLVARRIIQPLGLASTGFAEIDVFQGVRRGKPTPAWTFGALAGAGAIRSTAHDMLTFADAYLQAPDGPLGEAFLVSEQPVVRSRSGGVALGWLLLRRAKDPDGTVRWQNGGTFGGSSFLVVDRPRQSAVVSFGNTGPSLLRAPLDHPSLELFDSMTPVP